MRLAASCLERNRRRLAGLLLAAAGPAAHAGSTSDTFQVNATVVSACTVSGALLNFGSAIDPLLAALPLDTNAALTVVCTSTTPYTVALDAGANAGGAANFGARTMKNGSSSLAYQLYRDASRTTVWGDGSGGSSTASGSGSGTAQLLTIYGRLPSITGAVPGLYADTVTVTVTY